jgi:hypothetical protein
VVKAHLASYVLPCNRITAEEVEKAPSRERCDSARKPRFRRDLIGKAGNHGSESEDVSRGGDSEDKTPAFN